MRHCLGESDICGICPHPLSFLRWERSSISRTATLDWLVIKWLRVSRVPKDSRYDLAAAAHVVPQACAGGRRLISIQPFYPTILHKADSSINDALFGWIIPSNVNRATNNVHPRAGACHLRKAKPCQGVGLYLVLCDWLTSSDADKPVRCSYW
ncbi:hypothetical protein BV22DRAFT_166166 [Leucogyrophana mollusca]|uniref:Uncharacterized protein n=1 Tax=Leucogyrophana mollusca TaxID=85980 RepID=A0ACB8BSK1_9AGAM|nr:hypothetical protein BV22DRAFT_166166 [Leucogyrophana mollusca]